MKTFAGHLTFGYERRMTDYVPFSFSSHITLGKRKKRFGIIKIGEYILEVVGILI